MCISISSYGNNKTGCACFFPLPFPTYTVLSYPCSPATGKNLQNKKRKNTFYTHFPFYTVYNAQSKTILNVTLDNVQSYTQLCLHLTR